MAQSSKWIAFDGADEWEEVGATGATSKAPGAAPAAVAAKPRAMPFAGPPLAVDPFSEAVFPTPQTPVKLKPRPSAAQKAKAQADLASPTRKKCLQSGCSNDRFARGYCALHLSDV